MIHLVTCIKSQNDEDELHLMEMRRKIHTVVHLVDPRTSTGDSLLHLSVMKNNMLKSQQNLFDENRFAFFPSVEVTKLLVECGAKINALNAKSDAPLHTASQNGNYRQEVSCYKIFEFCQKFRSLALYKFNLIIYRHFLD